MFFKVFGLDISLQVDRADAVAVADGFFTAGAQFLNRLMIVFEVVRGIGHQIFWRHIELIADLLLQYLDIFKACGDGGVCTGAAFLGFG